jgi:hypothetical protein
MSKQTFRAVSQSYAAWVVGVSGAAVIVAGLVASVSENTGTATVIATVIATERINSEILRRILVDLS